MELLKFIDFIIDTTNLDIKKNFEHYLNRKLNNIIIINSEDISEKYSEYIIKIKKMKEENDD